MTDPSEAERQAIDAMYDAEHGWLTASNSDFDEQSRVLAMLRAVPLDYCVERAINEGALIPEDDSFVTLYRLASETETRAPGSARRRIDFSDDDPSELTPVRVVPVQEPDDCTCGFLPDPECPVDGGR